MFHCHSPASIASPGVIRRSSKRLALHSTENMPSEPKVEVEPSFCFGRDARCSLSAREGRRSMTEPQILLMEPRVGPRVPPSPSVSAIGHEKANPECHRSGGLPPLSVLRSELRLSGRAQISAQDVTWPVFQPSCCACLDSTTATQV